MCLLPAHRKTPYHNSTLTTLSSNIYILAVGWTAHLPPRAALRCAAPAFSLRARAPLWQHDISAQINRSIGPATAAATPRDRAGCSAAARARARIYRTPASRVSRRAIALARACLPATTLFWLGLPISAAARARLSSACAAAFLAHITYTPAGAALRALLPARRARVCLSRAPVAACARARVARISRLSFSVAACFHL